MRSPPLSPYSELLGAIPALPTEPTTPTSGRLGRRQLDAVYRREDDLSKLFPDSDDDEYDLTTGLSFLVSTAEDRSEVPNGQEGPSPVDATAAGSPTFLSLPSSPSSDSSLHFHIEGSATGEDDADVDVDLQHEDEKEDSAVQRTRDTLSFVSLSAGASTPPAILGALSASNSQSSSATDECRPPPRSTPVNQGHDAQEHIASSLTDNSTDSQFSSNASSSAASSPIGAHDPASVNHSHQSRSNQSGLRNWGAVVRPPKGALRFTCNACTTQCKGDPPSWNHLRGRVLQWFRWSDESRTAVVCLLCSGSPYSEANFAHKHQFISTLANHVYASHGMQPPVSSSSQAAGQGCPPAPAASLSPTPASSASTAPISLPYEARSTEEKAPEEKHSLLDDQIARGVHHAEADPGILGDAARGVPPSATVSRKRHVSSTFPRSPMSPNQPSMSSFSTSPLSTSSPAGSLPSASSSLQATPAVEWKQNVDRAAPAANRPRRANLYNQLLTFLHLLDNPNNPLLRVLVLGGLPAMVENLFRPAYLADLNNGLAIMVGDLLRRTSARPPQSLVDFRAVCSSTYPWLAGWLGQLQGLFSQVAAMGGGVQGSSGAAASVDLLDELYSWATTFTLGENDVRTIVNALQQRIGRMREVAQALCTAINRMIELHLTLPNQDDLVQQMASLRVDENLSSLPLPTIADVMGCVFSPSSPQSSSSTATSSAVMHSPGVNQTALYSDFRLSRLVMFSSFLWEHGPTLAVSDILQEEVEPYVLEFTGNVRGRMEPFLHAALVYTFTHQPSGRQIEVALDRVRSGRRMRYGLPGEALGQLRLRSAPVMDQAWEEGETVPKHYTLAQLIDDARDIDGRVYHLLDSTCWHFVGQCVDRVFRGWRYHHLDKYRGYAPR